MKTKFVALFICIFPFICFAQPKIETGIQLNGGWVFPGKYSSGSNYKNGFSSGIGCYLACHVWKPVSLITGLGYQYKEMQEENVVIYGSTGYGGSPYGYGYGGAYYWKKFPHHYLLIPLKMRLANQNGFFIQLGAEVAWLLNYKYINEKPEYNWTIGFGSNKHKLAWSFDYIQGFKEQGFGEITNGISSGTIYKNRMLQLTLSYPLFKRK